MGFDFLSEVFKLNEYSGPAEKGIIAGDYDGFLDSGSYSLNAVLSGTIYGGYTKNKITALAGESGVGKTFFALTAIKIFLDDNKDGGVFLFESESAISKQQLVDFGVDVKRVYVFPVETIQQFRHQCVVILNKYGDQTKKERQPMLIVLDSLGMLSTTKEIEDIEAGLETKDMTRAQLIKGAFRVLTLKLGKLGVPMILTNHTYKEMCLAEGTRLAMSSGHHKNIEDIVVGDEVKTRMGPKKVTAVYDDEALKENDNEMYEIEMEDGSIIQCTGNHMFLNKGRWTETKFLKEGYELLCD
jgi:RecA/RadA recombinase